MNPRDSFDSSFDLDPWGEDDEQSRILKEMQETLMKKKIEESKLKSKMANDAYNDLCDAVGSNSLMGTIDGGSSHIRLPLEAIYEIVARIESLKTNVLAEGAL